MEDNRLENKKEEPVISFSIIEIPNAINIYFSFGKNCRIKLKLTSDRQKYKLRN